MTLMLLIKTDKKKSFIFFMSLNLYNLVRHEACVYLNQYL